MEPADVARQKGEQLRQDMSDWRVRMGFASPTKPDGPTLEAQPIAAQEKKPVAQITTLEEFRKLAIQREAEPDRHKELSREP